MSNAVDVPSPMTPIELVDRPPEQPGGDEHENVGPAEKWRRVDRRLPW